MGKQLRKREIEKESHFALVQSGKTLYSICSNILETGYFSRKQNADIEKEGKFLQMRSEQRLSGARS